VPTVVPRTEPPAEGQGRDNFSLGDDCASRGVDGLREGRSIPSREVSLLGARFPGRSAMPPKSKVPAKVVPRFTSVAVVVSDRQKAVEWYTQKLGLDRLADSEHWQTVGTKGTGGALHLCQVSEFDPKAPLEPGNTGIALTLPGDFVKSCAALEARGVEFASPPTKYDWGWGATIRDPDGNEIYLAPEG